MLLFLELFYEKKGKDLNLKASVRGRSKIYMLLVPENEGYHAQIQHLNL